MSDSDATTGHPTTEEDSLSDLELESGSLSSDSEHEEHDETPENREEGGLNWLKSKLKKVHPAFIIAAIIATIWIEWVMIPIQSFTDHPTMWIGLAVYLVVTLLSIVFLKYLFAIRYKTLLSVMTANNLILTIPLGTVIALATGYTVMQLFSPQWEFTHDFVYIMLVSQLVVTAIIMFGVWWQARKLIPSETGQGDELEESEPLDTSEHPSLTHSYGLQTERELTASPGRVNGLTNGLDNVHGSRKMIQDGLTNGLGMVNGFTDSRRISNGLGNMIRPNRKNARQVAVPVVSIAIIGLLLFLPTVLVPRYDTNISRDWSGAVSYTDQKDDLNANVDIREYSAVSDGNYLWTKVVVEGEMMGDRPPNTNTLYIFIESDKNPETGYSIGGIGADFMIRTYGYEGAARRNQLFKFSETRDSGDWNGWSIAGPTHASVKGSTHETKTPLSILNVNGGAVIYFGIVDSEGLRDYSDTVVDLSREGTLIVGQTSVAPDIIERGVENVLQLELTARGRPLTLESLQIASDQGNVTQLQTPISIREDETKTFMIQIDATELDPGTLVEVQVKPGSIVTDGGSAVIDGVGARAYAGRAPNEIEIDGAFGDWSDRDLDIIPDEFGESSNPNVDIIEYQADESEAAIFLYLKVKGTMMGGVKIPALSEKRMVGQPSSGQQSANNKVNIGTSSQVEFPLPVLTGDDIAHIFIDADQNKGTGYHPTHPFEFPIGADFMIEISGVDGEIKRSEYFSFIGRQDQWSWELAGTVASGIDETRLETGISLAALNIEEPTFDAYLHITDWYGDEDYSDTTVSGGPETYHTSIPTRKNGGFGDGDIDTIDGASCAGDFGCHTLDSAQVPISMSFNPTGPYDPGQTDIDITVTVNMDDAKAGSIAGVSLRVGPSGSNSRYGLENDGWVIQSDPNSGTNNYIEQSGLIGGGDTDLVWTVTAPSSGGTYYLEATVWYDNDASGKEYNVTSEATITVIPEYQELLIPIFCVLVVVGVARLAQSGRLRKKHDET